MATITSTIVLQDRMTPALNAIVRSLSSTINAMSSLDSASSAAFTEARRDVQDAQRAVDELSSEINDLPSEINNATSGFSKMQASVVSVNQALQLGRTLIAGISKLTKLSDEMTQTAARLNLINDGLQTSEELQRKIYEAAQRARGSYGDMADTVAKLNLLAGNAFGSNNEAIKFAETMQKAFAVSGAGTIEQSGALRQMSQALASGVLRGEEFNSITENAPLIAKAIEDYMGVSSGKLRELASEGKVTAEIVKNAVYAAGESIDAQFAAMPMTFGAAMTMIKNTAMIEFQKVNNTISKAFNNEVFQQNIQQISAGIANIAKMAFVLVNSIVSNWDKISNIMTASAVVIGIVAGAIALKKTQILLSNIATAAHIILTSLATKATIKQTIATLTQSGATVSATAAQWALNAALLAKPYTWVVIGILAIIGAIVYWIKKVGGIRIAWLITVNAVLSGIDTLKIGFYGMYVAAAGMASAARIAVLGHLEKMVNGAIDLINEFIGLLNKIPGVNIEAVENITFAAAAAAQIEAEQKEREANLLKKKIRASLDKAKREEEISRLQNHKASSVAKKEVAQINELLEKMNASTAGIENTLGGAGGGAVVKGEADLSDEDIKLLKDVAAVEWTNKFTTLRPNMQVTFGDVHETADTRAIVRSLEEIIVEAYESSLAGEGI